MKLRLREEEKNLHTGWFWAKNKNQLQLYQHHTSAQQTCFLHCFYLQIKWRIGIYTQTMLWHCWCKMAKATGKLFQFFSSFVRANSKKNMQMCVLAHTVRQKLSSCKSMPEKCKYYSLWRWFNVPLFMSYEIFHLYCHHNSEVYQAFISLAFARLFQLIIM